MMYNGPVHVQKSMAQVHLDVLDSIMQAEVHNLATK